MSHPVRLSTESIAGRRPHLEDSVLAETLPDGRVLLAVADGMGGQGAGEVASALALEVLEEAVTEGEALEEAFRRAHRRVRARSRERGREGMGTTLVAAVLDGGRYHLANVGDSRAYRLDAEGIRRLTEHPSASGEAEAGPSRWEDAPRRSLGLDEEVEVELFGPFEVEPDTALVLCSDGLFQTLSDRDVHDTFLGSAGPGAAAQSLVSRAFERRSDDNISVVLAEFGEVPRARAPGGAPGDLDVRGDPGATA